MAEKIISPGVFTTEKDLSFLPQGIAEIGAAFIGPSQKGPAFVPVVIETQNEFTDKFGEGDYYMPLAVRSYLKSAGRAIIVRVLGVGTYSIDTLPIYGTGSSYGQLLAVLTLTSGGAAQTFDISTVNIEYGDTVDDFLLHVGSNSYSASLDSSNVNYITNVIGTDPGGSKPIYVYLNFMDEQDVAVAGVEDAITGSNSSVGFGAYSHASTTWVTSQTLGGETYNLFKFHTLSHGTYVNSEFKIGIFGVTLASELPNSDYPTFNVVLRELGDTDARQSVLETYNNVTLDPDSPNYLPRVIGDRYPTYTTIDGESKLVYEGDYPNKSRYIRVEMSTDGFPESSAPFGFGAYSLPINDSLIQSMSYVESQSINGETNTRAYFGFDFTTNSDGLEYLKALPSSTSTGSNSAFNLDSYLTGLTGSNANRKFALAFQGGNNGYSDIRNELFGKYIDQYNTQGFNCSAATTSGTVAYRNALDTISNPDEIDINLIIIPGILHGYHNSVTTYAIDICETRQDCFYIMDVGQTQNSPAQVTEHVISLDSNYVGTYYPWVKVLHPTTNKPIWVPPSVVLAGVYSFNDVVAQEWWAPAGLNRGGIGEALEAYTRLTKNERDDLYEGRVNPIATFPGEGVTTWGQKTLQVKASALDRINVRRLLIAVKKFIASTSRYLVFEQNTDATRQRFLNIVNPYLESVQQQAGLYAFRVIMDETNNTPDIIDRNQLYGQIYLQPAKPSEFVVLDFNILPTGATFPTA